MAEHEPISKWTEKLFCYSETRACSFNSIARHILTPSNLQRAFQRFGFVNPFCARGLTYLG